MINLFNPLFLALSRALREDESASSDGWDQMLDRSELGLAPEQMTALMGAPIYVPDTLVEKEQHSN